MKSFSVYAKIASSVLCFMYLPFVSIRVIAMAI